MPTFAAVICSRNGIIATVSEHITSSHALASTGIIVGIDEPAHFGVVITALEVVQPGICVVDVTTVPQGIVDSQGRSHGAADAENLAPGIIGVSNDRRAVEIHQHNYVALGIEDVIICRAVVLNADRSPGGIVGEVHLGGAVGHGHQQSAAVDVIPGGGAVAAAGAHSVRAIGVRPGGGAVAHAFQPAATLPGVAPGTITKGVANRIISNGFAAVGSQQVAPVCIAIAIGNSLLHCTQSPGGVGILLLAENVACAVVSPNPGFSRCLVILPDQLISNLSS